MSQTANSSAEWVTHCMAVHGRVLIGPHAHYCPTLAARALLAGLPASVSSKGVPLDETCAPWPCACFEARPDAEPKPADPLDEAEDGRECQ